MFFARVGLLFTALLWAFQLQQHYETFIYCSEGSPSTFNPRLLWMAQLSTLVPERFTIDWWNLNVAVAKSCRA